MRGREGRREKRALTPHDLEIAARYAERRAKELRDEAATATTVHARRSLANDAQEHEDRARRYRRAAGQLDAREPLTRRDVDEALDTLREHLHNSSLSEARRVINELKRLHLEALHARDLAETT